MTRLFLSGISGGGAEAWPTQVVGLRPNLVTGGAPDPIVFIDPNVNQGGPASHAVHLLSQAGDALHLVGHSYGGIAPMLAAAHAPDRVRSLAFFEPACMSLARGRPAIEWGIVAAQRVWDEYARSELPPGTFAARFFAALYGNAAPGPDLNPRVGANLRAWGAPWVRSVDPAVFHRIPTLVITGGWDNGFEEIADVMVGAGARHEMLAGYGDRPQDHPDANALLREFWAEV